MSSFIHDLHHRTTNATFPPEKPSFLEIIVAGTLEQQILDAIHDPQTQIVSFDVFDTLLLRPVLSPADLFYLMEIRARKITGDPDLPFHKLRIWAEKRARHILHEKDPSAEDVTLNAIYHEMVEAGIFTHAIAEQIKQTEIEIELHALQPRKSIRPLYDAARKAGKRIIAISDMYLAAEHIGRAIEEAGFTDIATLYVSSELRLSKVRGSLFDHVLRELNIPAEKIVHIGDNRTADYDVAKSRGLRAFRIPKTTELMAGARAVWKTKPDEWEQIEPGVKIVMGAVANRFFDAIDPPEWEADSRFNGDPTMLGYAGVGMWLLFMGKWIIEEARKQGCDHIAFVARDGYLPLEVHKRLTAHISDAPTASYLPISRSICYQLDMHQPYNIVLNGELLAIGDDLTIRDALPLRFGLEWDEDITDLFAAHGITDLDIPCRDETRFFAAALALRPMLEAAQNEFHATAKRFYEAELPKDRTIALFDLGYRARAQRSLETLLNREFTGLYVASFKEIYERRPISHAAHYLMQPFNSIFGKRPFFTALIELMISEYEKGSHAGFEMDGKTITPIHEEEIYGAHECEIIQAMHQGALELIDDMGRLLQDEIFDLYATHNASFAPLADFMTHPLAGDAAMFKGFRFGNGKIGETLTMVADREENSAWNEGWRALNGGAGPSRPVSEIIYDLLYELGRRGGIIGKGARTARPIFQRVWGLYRRIKERKQA